MPKEDKRMAKRLMPLICFAALLAVSSCKGIDDAGLSPDIAVESAQIDSKTEQPEKNDELPHEGTGWELREGLLTIRSDEGMEAWCAFRAACLQEDETGFTDQIVLKAQHLLVEKGVTMIPDEAFYKMTCMQTVSLPDGLLSIGEDAFCHCLALEELLIPDSVERIDMGAFVNCPKLEKLTLPEGIESLPPDMIGNGGALKELYVPNSVAYIDDNALLSEGLQRIVFLGTVDEIVNLSVYRMPELSQVVFMEGPPRICSYERTESDVGPFGLEYLVASSASIYYLNENVALWAPNGETEWMSRPLIGIDSLDELPPL